MNRNRNRKLKASIIALGAGFFISSIPLQSVASPIAGAVASMYNNSQKSVGLEDTSPLSGANLALSNILALATKNVGQECEPAWTESESAPVVKEEVVGQKPQSQEEVAPYYANMAVAIADDYVNIRSEASADSEALGKLYHNGYAEVLDVNGEWAHIKSGSVDGYIKTEFLSIGDEQLVLSVSNPVARVQADVVNVRTDTTIESDIVGQAVSGKALLVRDVDMAETGWIKVAVGGEDGYVNLDYVNVEREFSSVAESKAEEEARLEREAAERRAAEAARTATTSTKSSSSTTTYNASTTPAVERSYNPPSGSDGSSVASYALQFTGNPYVYGGTSLTNGTDCSGFVMSVYNQFGVSLPHSSSSLRSVGYGVDTMEPGDIICYSGHVGIYIGGGQIVHASNRRDGIKVSNANYRTILAVRRIF